MLTDFVNRYPGARKLLWPYPVKYTTNRFWYRSGHVVPEFELAMTLQARQHIANSVPRTFLAMLCSANFSKIIGGLMKRNGRT